MGKNFPVEGEGESAARVYHTLMTQPVASPREVCEAGDEAEAEAVLVDELAARFRAEGASAGGAMGFAKSMRAWLREKDRAAGAGAVGGVEEPRGKMAVVEGGAKAEGGVAGSALQRALAEVARLREAAERQREVMAQIWAWPDARKGVGAWFFAMGLPLYGCNSMRELARLRQVSVEDISNVVGELQRIGGLPRNAQQKSAAAVESYARENGAKRMREAA